ncbi:MAG TPA: hypothetical protein ENN55_02335 [Firmicutes bacterium]|nr:hypothetical protein [Bacillota bacterium]
MSGDMMKKIFFGAGILLVIFGGISVVLLGAFTGANTAALAAGGLFTLIYIFIDRERVLKAAASRQARYGINAGIYTLLVLGIIVVIQAIAVSRPVVIDLTEEKKYTLSEQTLNVLNSLDAGINAYYFYSVSARSVRVEDRLKMYETASPKFRFFAVDADKNPAEAQRLGIERYGLIALQREDTGAIERVELLSEEGITNALLRLVRDEVKKIYFTTGHGEPAIDAPHNDKNGISIFAGELKKVNYGTGELEIFSEGKVPEDCAVLVIAGPKTDIFPGEADAISDYLLKGGRIVVMYPPMTGLPNLEKLMLKYGITAHNDIVVDNVSRMLGGDFLMPIISSYDYHKITAALGRTSSFMPMARSFNIKSEINGIKLYPIAETHPSAWGETDLAGIRQGRAAKDEKDYSAPLIVAAIADIDNGVFASGIQSVDTNAKIVVFGSVEFVLNNYIGTAANKNFVMNTISYLAEDEDLLAIPPKDNSFEPLFMSKVQGRMLFLIPAVFLPLLFLAAGIMVFVRRRML